MLRTKTTLFIIPAMALALIQAVCLPLALYSEEAVQDKIVYTYTNSGKTGNYPKGSVVDRYGKLKVVGTQLCDEKGNPVQLRGVSLHQAREYSRFVNNESLSYFAKNWKIDVFRVVMTPAEYLLDKTFDFTINDAVNYCESNGIYVLIDWHILGEKDPYLLKEPARKYFQKKAFQFGAKKHVLYEICNEPNGAEVNWDTSIKPYAEYVIPAIRAGDSNSVVIVGTPRWSQDVDQAAANPLAFSNVMYTLHFYAGTHGQELKSKFLAASTKIPIFVTEWGTSQATGDGGPYVSESKAWLDLLKTKNVSWINWSISDKSEKSAIFKYGTSGSGDWQDKDFTDSGKFLRSLFTGK